MRFCLVACIQCVREIDFSATDRLSLTTTDRKRRLSSMILRLPNTKVSQPILPNKYDDFLDELLQVKQALHSAVVLDLFTTTVNTEKEN